MRWYKAVVMTVLLGTRQSDALSLRDAHDGPGSWKSGFTRSETCRPVSARLSFAGTFDIQLRWTLSSSDLRNYLVPAQDGKCLIDRQRLYPMTIASGIHCPQK